MSRGKRNIITDLALRAFGLALALLGALAIRHLFHMTHASPRHAASLAEIALAALGFLGVSAGAALACLGAHIFDEVEVSASWAPQRLPSRPA